MNNIRKGLLLKSRDSALHAISSYNDPRSTFRTGSFTVLMTIAWTSLLHCFFEIKKINYYYKQDNGRYIKIDGDKKAWDLSECVKHVFKDVDPIRMNLELFIKLRDKIEHRNMPAIDKELIGECQSLVLNYEEFAVNTFGKEYSLIDTMFIPIQLVSARRELPKSKLEASTVDFVKRYRNLMEPEVLSSQKFTFKAYLVPIIGNHRSSSDVAIEFIKYDENNSEEMKKYEKAIIGIKEKHIPVANINRYRPTMVIEKLRNDGIGENVTTGKLLNIHTRLWKKFKVRPATKSDNKEKTKSEYCIYDSAHGDYLYTDKWVELVKAELTKL